MVDFAHCMRDLVDIHFPQADTIVVVMDNLNTHKLASLYEAFPPAEARRIAAKLGMAVGSIWLKSNSVSCIDSA